MVRYVLIVKEVPTTGSELVVTLPSFYGQRKIENWSNFRVYTQSKEQHKEILDMFPYIENPHADFDFELAQKKDDELTREEYDNDSYRVFPIVWCPDNKVYATKWRDELLYAFLKSEYYEQSLPYINEAYEKFLKKNEELVCV